MDSGNFSFQSLLEEPVLEPTLAQRFIATLAYPSAAASEQLQALIHNEASRMAVNPVRAFTTAIAVFMIFIVLYTGIASRNSSLRKQEPGEPEVAPLRSTFFYNLIPLLQLGPSRFMQQIRKTTAMAKPYTVVLGPTKASSGRIYSFNHPEDLRMLYKNWKNFTWLPFVLKYTKAFAGHARKDEELVFSQLDDKKSWFLGFVKMYHLMAVAGKGGYLDEAKQRAGELLGEDICKLAATEGPKQIELSKWLQKSFFRSTTGMYFGKYNFYEAAEDPDRILESYMLWEDSVNKLTTPGIDIFNNIFHRKIIARREEMFAAHRRYLEDPERLKHALTFIQDRRVSCEDAGYSLDGNTRSDMILVFGSMVNARNAIYWSIYHAFADKKLLSDIKSDLHILNAVTVTPEGVGKINMANVSIHIKALFNEVLRNYQDAFSIRKLKEDTSVTLSDGNSYRLKKDGVVLVNGTNLYSDPNTWGDDVKDFNPYRFITPPANKDQKKLQDAAFRPFGGGLTLCPGRKLAYAECAAVVTALVAFFKVQVPEVPPRPVEYDGMGVLGPAEDCILNIEAREGIREVVFEW